MKNIIAPITLVLSLGLAACGGKASLEDVQKLKAEACACKDKACADAVEKKADKVLTDDTIKALGDKGMEEAIGIAACLAQHQ